MSKFDMSVAKLNLIIFAIRFAGSVGLWLFVGMVSLLVYWNLEKDPLDIVDTGTNPEVARCEKRVFTFTRDVTTTKFLEVQVARELVDLSTGEAFGLPAIPPYSGPAGSRRWTYTVEVPHAYKEGLYEYRPTLTYKVNPIKTITKPAPAQKVDVCGQ